MNCLAESKLNFKAIKQSLSDGLLIFSQEKVVVNTMVKLGYNNIVNI